MEHLALFHFPFLSDHWILPIFLLIIIPLEYDPGKRENKKIFMKTWQFVECYLA